MVMRRSSDDQLLVGVMIKSPRVERFFDEERSARPDWELKTKPLPKTCPLNVGDNIYLLHAGLELKVANRRAIKLIGVARWGGCARINHADLPTTLEHHRMMPDDVEQQFGQTAECGLRVGRKVG